jgi:hypothetical protein
VTSVTRLIPRDDRNISTTLPAELRLDVLGAVDPSALDRDQLDAALALLARSPLDLDRARRIALCPPLDGPRDPVWRRACRLRACPRCAERRARRLARRMIERAIAYPNPRAVLVTCPSRTLLDLPTTLDALHRGLATLRRRRWFSRGVVRGVLALECPTTRDGHRWAVHCHGVVDVVPGVADDSAWLDRLGAEWSALVGTPGAKFELEASRSVASLSRYALKVGQAKTWSPGARDLPPARRAHLDSALRGRRLVVSWGGPACRA